MENPTTLQCGHTYCHDCIAKWLGECDNRCPECRVPAITMTDSAGNTASAPATRPSVSTPDEHSKVGRSVTVSNAVNYVANVPSEEIEPLLRALLRRPAGRNAVLNSPTVRRAITQCKRDVAHKLQLRCDDKKNKFVAQASRAKGCATKATKKCSRAEARVKGLRTLLSKVIGCIHVHSLTHSLIKHYTRTPS